MASPKSFEAAVEVLETQKLAAQDIQDVVSAGRLEEAGIKVLNLQPQVTSAGRIILSSLQAKVVRDPARDDDDNNKMAVVDDLKMSMVENQFNSVIALWGDCDVVIGQGLRGEMGVSAVAQLQILSSLKDATIALDDFLTTVKVLSGNA